SDDQVPAADVSPWDRRSAAPADGLDCDDDPFRLGSPGGRRDRGWSRRQRPGLQFHGAQAEAQRDQHLAERRSIRRWPYALLPEGLEGHLRVTPFAVNFLLPPSDLKIRSGDGGSWRAPLP